jgi:uncharacterized membrane protein
MLQLIFGLALFLGAHSVSMIRPDWRSRTIDRMGPGPWKLGYSLLSAVGIVLIVLGYGDARATDPVVLYQPPVWLRHLALVLMLPVFPLLLAAYLPGRIRGTLKHPMLVAHSFTATSIGCFSVPRIRPGR